MYSIILLSIISSITALQSPLNMDHNPNNNKTMTGNPIIPGWYADPEARIFTSSNTTKNNQTPQKQYWLYPTTSAPYDKQTTFDAFSSPDLLTWTKHPHILNITRIPWSTNRAAWAPSVTYRDGEYFMYFSVGDGAGIGVARSVTRRPEGPFEDVLGRPLVPGVVRGAEGIDAQVFVDYMDPNEDDGGVHGGDGDGEGRNWLYFGGWGHAIVVELGSDMVSLKGEYKEITPEGYVEGPWIMKRDGVYYFMFSVGGYVSPSLPFPIPYTLYPNLPLYQSANATADCDNSWGDNSYGVSYVKSASPTGPFTTQPTKILHGNDKVGTGTGHNSIFTPDGKDYYIVYHRRFPNDTERDHRVTCVDRMEFDERGDIRPVIITEEGVEGRVL